MKLLITLKPPKKLTADFRGAGAKGLFRAYHSEASLIILIHLQYINNSSLYIIQFTNVDALPNFTNGNAYPFGTNGNAYTNYTNGHVLPNYTNGYGYPKKPKSFSVTPRRLPPPPKKKSISISRPATQNRYSTQTLLISDMPKYSI